MIEKLLGRLARAGYRSCPPPPPLRCSQRLTQRRHLPPWAVPAVAIAACNGGFPPGPSTGNAMPIVFLGVAGGMVLGAATGTVAECAGGDGGDGGSDADISQAGTPPSSVSCGASGKSHACQLGNVGH